MATSLLNTLASFNPALSGGGLLLSAVSHLGDILTGNKKKKQQKEAAFMQALSYMDAADMQEHMGILAKDISDSNAAASLIYAKNLLEIGPINMDDISYQIAKEKIKLAKTGSKLMQESALRSIATGVELSGSALTKMANIQDEVMDQIANAQYQGDMATTRTLVQMNQLAAHARGAAIEEKTRGLLQQAQYNYLTMSQKANALGIISAAKIMSDAKTAELWGKGFGAGTTLIGKVVKQVALREVK